MSQRNKARESRAYTIPELIIGFAIFVLIITAAVSVYAMISQVWRENLVMNELSLDANIAIEKMVHGKSVNTGLLAAKSISAPLLGISANSVNYTDVFGASRSFYHSGGKIYAEDGSPIVSNVDESAISLSNIFYNVDDRMVLITVSLKKSAGKKVIKFCVKTEVSLRN